MKLITPYKYNILAPLIPQSIKPWIRERVVAHCVKKDMYPVPERDVFPLFIKPGDTVIDVGANIGAYATVFANIVGETGVVLACEPVTPTYKILCRATHHLGAIVPVKVALSDHAGKGTIRLLRGDETVGEISLFRSTLEPIWLGDATTDVTEEVHLDTVGNLLARGAAWHLKPAFIKCDAEGHDWQVIKGADFITKCYRPVWCVEINENPLQSVIPDYFGQIGYECFVQVGDRLRRWQRGQLSPTQNYFFAPGGTYPGPEIAP